MATEMYLAVKQFRLQQWMALKQECNSRQTSRPQIGAGNMALQEYSLLV